jgi:hypothetical protein
MDNETQSLVSDDYSFTIEQEMQECLIKKCKELVRLFIIATI